MNFYEYYQPGETLDEPPVYLAGLELLKHKLQVIPLAKGLKEPANVKSVYELISRPINDKNFDFYFKDRDVDIGMILLDDMEFLDVDSKHKPNLTKDFLKAVEFGWPELYEKLVIDFTPSGGCHLLYRSEQVGGKASMAKVHSKPNPLTIIERINKFNGKQYIKIAPSEGYNLYQKSPLEIEQITAEQRNWLGALAVSFNEVHIPEVKKPDADREDSPWNVFNSRSDWKYIRNELIDRNWSIVQETTEKVLVKRPGQSQQRSSGAIFKDSNILYLYTVSSEFEDSKGYSPFGVYTLFYHEGNIGAASKQLASEGCGKNNLEEGQFWKKKKTKIEIKYTELLNWVHGIGYRFYNKTLVQVVNNVVELVDESAIKRAFLNEVEFDMQDQMYERVPTIFSEGGGLMSMIDELEDNFITDTIDSTWLFFRNLAIKINSNGCEPYEYKDIKGYIWQSAVINRDFYECDYSNCDADRFCEILGGVKKNDLQEIIGYSISKYKDPLNPRAVILIEDIDANEEGESQGGSGKGLLFQFIKQFRKSADFDGKNFRPADPFLYQNVEPDTSLIFIDDVEKSFKFNSLFSILTNSLLINKKNKPQVIIPFDKSPKVFVTSNYSVGGMDISSMRRKYEFAITKYFGEDIEPIDVFKRQFFSDWDKQEWLRFDNFITDCCIKYLSESNKKLIGNITANSSERSLINNTNKDFIDYMDGQLYVNFFDFAPIHFKTKSIKYPDGSTTSNAVDTVAFLNAIKEPGNYFLMPKESLFEKINKVCKIKYFTTTKLTQWVNRWAKARGVEIDTRYKQISDTDRCYRIIKWSFHLFDSKSGNDPEKVGTGWKPNQKWE